MAESKSIKLFSFNRNHLRLIGIHPDRFDLDGSTFHIRNWIFIINCLAFSLPPAAFFSFEAKSMLEYGFSFFTASVGFFMICIYVAMVGQMKNTLTFIENCEGFIGKSK